MSKKKSKQKSKKLTPEEKAYIQNKIDMQHKQFGYTSKYNK